MKKHQRRILGIVVMVLALAASGCIFKRSHPGGWKPVKSSRSSLVHEVKWAGETLPMIAKWYTGDSRKWKSIVDANPAINPQRLYIGNKVFIPGEMVKKNEPMPRDYISRLGREGSGKRSSAGSEKKAGQKGKRPGSDPDEQEEFEIFGPK